MTNYYIFLGIGLYVEKFATWLILIGIASSLRGLVLNYSINCIIDK